MSKTCQFPHLNICYCLQYFFSTILFINRDIEPLCKSRYCQVPENIHTTPTEGIGFSRGGGELNLPNFPVERGCTIGKYFQRVIVMRKRVTKKKHKNLPQQFVTKI